MNRWELTQFASSDWLSVSWIILAALALLISLIFGKKILKRWRRFTHYGAHFLATGALLGLALEPQIKLSDIEPLTLLTPGLTVEKAIEQVASSDESEPFKLIPSAGFWLQTGVQFSVQESGYNKIAPSAKRISDPQQILLSHGQPKTMTVIGDGLTESQWQAFDNPELNYQVPPERTGLIDIFWQKNILLGESVYFSARFQSSQAQMFSIRLLDPVGDELSRQKILPGEMISLIAKPKTPGRHLFRWQLIDKKGLMVSQQEFDVYVSEKANASVLLLQSSPSFEARQLQRWLSQSDADLLVKTQISQAKFTTRFAGQRGNSKVEFSNSFLEKFDLLIIDGRSLNDLSTRQRKTLYQAVSEGLGLLIWVDDALLQLGDKQTSQLLAGVSIEHQTRPVLLSLQWRMGVDRATLDEYLKVEVFPAKISAKGFQLPELKPLVQSTKGEPLVESYRIGQGRVGVSLIKSSYQWVTRGYGNEHADYWQHLLASLGRRLQKKTILPFADGEINFVDRLTRICAQGVAGGKIKLVHWQSQSLTHWVDLPAVQQSQAPGCGFFWPQKAGWYRGEVIKVLSQAGSSLEDQVISPRWFYVYPKNAWRTRQQKAKVRATLAKQQAFRVAADAQYPTRKKPVDPWIFWWLLILSATIIWLNEKLD